jgi:hypothetical protein
MYLCPTYYTLENIVHYKNLSERYKFLIRAARNISKLRGQCKIKPVSLNPGIRNIYVPVAYILYLRNIVHYKNSNKVMLYLAGYYIFITSRLIFY